MKLKNHQIEAIEKFKNLNYGALFMEPGTGKTLIILKLAEIKGFSNVYVISPKDLLTNFKEQAKQWGIDLNIIPVNKYIFEKEVLYNQFENEIDVEALFVVDESIFFKNINANRTKNLLKLGEKVTYKFILNGTPISKSNEDLYTQIKFLDNRIFPYSIDVFNFNFNKKKFYTNKKKQSSILGFDNDEQLMKIIKDFTFFCKLDDVEKVKKDYKLIQYEIPKSLKSVDLLRGLKENFQPNIIKLQRMQNTSLKMELLLNEIENKENYIINCNFLSEVEDIHYNLLKRNSHEIFILTGDKKEQKEFKKCTKRKVLIKTVQSGSFGLNFQKDARIMINYSYNFDFSKMLQNERRIIRIGQDKKVNIIQIHCSNGIDNLFFSNLLTKKITFEYLMNNVNKLADNDYKEYLEQMESVLFEKKDKSKLYSKEEKELFQYFSNQDVERVEFKGTTNEQLDKEIDDFIDENELCKENVNYVYNYYKKHGISIQIREFSLTQEDMKRKSKLSYPIENEIKGNNLLTNLNNLNNQIHFTKNFGSTSFVDRLTNSKYLKKAIIIAFAKKEKVQSILKIFGNNPTNFKPERAMNIYFYLINQLEKENDFQIADPCFGFGGRLLGAYLLALKTNKRISYVGYDVNEESKKEILKLMKALPNLRNFKYELIIRSSELVDYSKFDVLFTSPPYFNTEIYQEENDKQSINQWQTYEEWFENFLKPICNAKSKIVAINVLSTAKAPFLEEDVKSILNSDYLFFSTSKSKNEKIFIKK